MQLPKKSMYINNGLMKNGKDDEKCNYLENIQRNG